MDDKWTKEVVGESLQNTTPLNLVPYMHRQNTEFGSIYHKTTMQVQNTELQTLN
jgi:hypothetical protein